MDLLIKARSGRRCDLHSTDAVEVTETAGNGKPIRGIRKLKAGEELPSGVVIIKNGWDHEHCELCWTNVNPGDDAYRNMGMFHSL